MELTCPKCQAAMRQYERSGVHVDQCTECRGIFLDRGELERLVDAENSFNAAPAAATAGARPPAPPEYDRVPERHDQRPYDSRGYERGYESRGHDSRYDSHGYGHRKKRKSFFEELFD